MALWVITYYWMRIWGSCQESKTENLCVFLILLEFWKLPFILRSSDLAIICEIYICSAVGYRFVSLSCVVTEWKWGEICWNLIFFSLKKARDVLGENRQVRQVQLIAIFVDCRDRRVKFNIRGVRYRRFSLATKSVRRDQPIKLPSVSPALKNKEPSKQKNYFPLVTLMEDDDSNCSREEISLNNTVDDTADVLRGSPSRIIIIVSAFSFSSLQESNTSPIEENLSREEVRSLTSSEVCRVCFVLQYLTP